VGGGHEAAISVLARIFFSPPTRPLSMAASSSAQSTTSPQVSIFLLIFILVIVHGLFVWFGCYGFAFLLYPLFGYRENGRKPEDLKLWFLKVVL